MKKSKKPKTAKRAKKRRVIFPVRSAKARVCTTQTAT